MKPTERVLRESSKNASPLHGSLGELVYLSNFTKILEKLKARPEGVNEPDRYGRTLIAYARSVSIAQVLVALGANIHYRDQLLRTPLHHISPSPDKSAEPVVKYLIEQGADINAVDKDGATPLITACLNKTGNHFVPLFIEDGADVNITDKQGNTALHYACRNYSPDAIQALCAAGAYADIQNNQKKIPYVLLELRNNLYYPNITESVTALIKAGTDPNAVFADVCKGRILNTLGSYEGTYKNDSPFAIAKEAILAGAEPYPKDGTDLFAYCRSEKIRQRLKEVTDNTLMYLEQISSDTAQFVRDREEEICEVERL